MFDLFISAQTCAEEREQESYYMPANTKRRAMTLNRIGKGGTLL
jgi:hypothetical protein